MGSSASAQQEVKQLEDAWPTLKKPHSRTNNPDTPTSEDIQPKEIKTVRLNPTNDPVTGAGSEIQLAASSDGKNVVIATNIGLYSSNDSGVTFSGLKPVPLPFATSPNNLGDPSITLAQSGNFYTSYIGLPGPAGALPSAISCAASVSISKDAGKTFTFLSNATLCTPTGAGPGGLCFPDQPQIAADGFNGAGSSKADLLYEAWRNTTVQSIFGIGAPSTCSAITGGSLTPSLACSSDSGTTWSTPSVIGAGDFPRLAVGPDGFVYILLRDGANVMLYKFSRCDSGLNLINGFPVLVETINDPPCPIPGLDRCLESALASATVAVDDVDPAHVFVAYAENTAPDNDNILVRQSFDAGLHWDQQVPRSLANSLVPGRRFMPWTCTSGGAVFVSWYDRRAATPAANDLTDFFVSAVPGPREVRFAETKLSTTPDPQCAMGWPGGSDRVDDSTSCSVQPQIAGHCYSWLGNDLTGTLAPPICDLKTGVPCFGGTHCGTFGGGVPKYGDYNGIACTASKVFTAWASNVVPGNGTFPSTFASTVSFPPTQLIVHEVVAPADDGGQFNVQVDSGAFVAQNLGNGDAATFKVTPGNHQIADSPANGVSTSDYLTWLGGDCDSSGNINVPPPPAPNAVCVFGHMTAAAQCLASCAVDENNCFQNPNSDPNQCRADFYSCSTACPPPPSRAWVTFNLSVLPFGDRGAFDLVIDDTVYAHSVANGGSTGPIAITPSDPSDHGPHIVSLNGPLNLYRIQWSGDCAPSTNTGPWRAVVSYAAGFRGTCTVIATNNAQFGNLNIWVESSPPSSTAKFDVLLDGQVVATHMSAGTSTGFIPVLQGTHIISETIEPPDQAAFNISFSGACDPSGSILIPPGGMFGCAIWNIAKPVKPPPPQSKAQCGMSCDALVKACRKQQSVGGTRCDALAMLCAQNCR
jgi:hypothetical protein